MRQWSALSPLSRRASKLFLVLVALGLIVTAGASRAAADQRFVVRTASALDGGLLEGTLDPAAIIGRACAAVGCTVRYTLDGQIGELFLVTTGDLVDAQAFLTLVSTQPGVTNAEIDQVVGTMRQTGGLGPPALHDRLAVDFFGTSVWQGYLNQPAAQIVGLDEARTSSGLTGWNVIVALIDTGVDPTHPVLQPVLLGGYDFTRNSEGGSELNDLPSEPIVEESEPSQATPDAEAPEEEEAEPVLVNQSTMAVVDQSTMAVVDHETHAAFGHGTMVAGIIHLVAPEARIMPLKAFAANGAGYHSDILRAVYYAVTNGAKVLNLSFSYQSPSNELATAVRWAVSYNVLVVASAGNSGQHAPSYPGSLSQVIGVASTDEMDALSTFSNYGEDLFWIAAPGEGVITTYPFGTYAATSGTSFSAPFAAGTAALLKQAGARGQEEAMWAIGRAAPMAGVARGRLDVVRALSPESPTAIIQP
jgi:subtilisin family serine protease